jgi:DNA mismatch repair protein MutH
MSQPRPLLSPPETEEQLLAQAQQLSGYTGGTCRAGYAGEFKTR